MPELSASTDGRPVLDQEAMVRDALLSTLPRLRRLPDRIDRIVTLAARGDLRVRSVLDEDGKRVLRTLVNRALLAGVGAAFLVVGAVLLGSADTGPVLSGGTSLIDIFGYGGLLTGTVLLLRVVAAVARDGTT
jgi:ubiquinone biosynthesis protein